MATYTPVGRPVVDLPGPAKPPEKRKPALWKGVATYGAVNALSERDRFVCQPAANDPPSALARVPIEAVPLFNRLMPGSSHMPQVDAAISIGGRQHAAIRAERHRIDSSGPGVSVRDHQASGRHVP
jgi:hypothetical protein